ncbi:hypothetical protein G6O69_04260 [Pseudenhygromyxa sp. WMMC2535]|uniref:hypothetical protein n=1 Tax=Pseudenhygromyxa sp. WMMC2535 TaxID=2712867 RepID=UPI001556A6CF|nr:hypothetical protein [Pseudenhygromyxa sp. WMMC2535]NVB37031.1 hypothetical protein [Pseudenhygromyxa sp. WMMC2535]
MLIPITLAQGLEQQWLSGEGSSNPSSVNESGQRFADVVSQWFSSAMALTFPCTTALARKAQLATLAGSALASPSAAVAGARLGQALSVYMTGQSFGAGVSGAPVGAAAAVAAFAAVFADLEAAPEDRALQLALGTWGLALSTQVLGPPPFPAPIL